MQEATTTAATMTVTAAPAAMAITVMAAPTTPMTVTAATLGITTGNTTPNSNTSTPPAISDVTGTTASDDNPFLGTLPYNWYVVLRAKDPKVRRARVCETVVGLVLQVTQVTNAAPWLR